MARKQPRKDKKSTRPLPDQLRVQLLEADGLIRRGQLGKARNLLSALDQRYPRQKHVLSRLAQVSSALRDFRLHLSTCEHLAALSPDDPDVLLMLAGAYLTNVRPVLGLHTFQRFLRHWPNHSRAEEVRQTLTSLQPVVQERLDDLGLIGAEGEELAAWHEELQSLLEDEQYPQARRVADKLLARRPQFAPALNNVGESYAREGRLDEAIAHAQRVLSFDPNNFHALANLTRYLCMSGRPAEARPWAERLKAIEAQNRDIWAKKAEALSYLGDDEGVLAVWRGAEQAERSTVDANDALFYHLVAVAAYRQGKEEEAVRHWEQALRRMPGFDLAEANLKDLRRPLEQRHAAWPYHLAYWMPKKTIDDLAVAFKPTGSSNDQVAAQQMLRFFHLHPEIPGLIPMLLDRGDPDSRKLALQLAKMARTPEMAAVLRDFALSQRGPDRMRMEAAQLASQTGLLPGGLVRLWVQGEWRDLFLMAFEINPEPEGHVHGPQVEEWLGEALVALHHGEGERAEGLLKQALAVEPDHPSLLNNLAAAYERQGRDAEALALVREVHQRHPDYLFARTSLAKKYVDQGQFDDAKALLDPLLSRRRMHTSEFAALCDAEITLVVAQDNRDAARSWFQMAQKAVPRHPGLEHWRSLLDEPGKRPSEY